MMHSAFSPRSYAPLGAPLTKFFSRHFSSSGKTFAADGAARRAMQMTMSEPQGMDRRTKPRAAIALDVKVHAPDQQFVLLSRTVDLSAGGAFVRTSRALPAGSMVRVAFQRGSDRNPLTLDATVIRSGATDGGRSPGIALRFVNVSELDESLLNELIARRSS